MRKYYMDNLRWLIILVLFPYHTLIIYSDIASYYFHVTNSAIASAFMLSFSPWFMQLLFVVAGIATFYSLKKRTSTQYLKERVSKLLIPLVAGVILVIPVSIYFGFLYNGYTGSFLNLWWGIFTNPSLQGLALGPLWFLLYLFIASLVALPIILKFGKRNLPIKTFTIPKLLLLVFPLVIASYFLELSPGKSLVQFFLLFVFGYFLVSDDDAQEKLDKYRWPLFISLVILTISLIAMNVTMNVSTMGGLVTAISTLTNTSPVVAGFLLNLYLSIILWVGVLGIMGMGKHYLEFKNSKTLYLAAVSFPIYIFHIVWINMFAYYIISWIPNQIVQVILIMALSFVFTIATIEVIRRIPVIRTLFGMKG